MGFCFHFEIASITFSFDLLSVVLFLEKDLFICSQANYKNDIRVISCVLYSFSTSDNVFHRQVVSSRGCDAGERC